MAEDQLPPAEVAAEGALASEAVGEVGTRVEGVAQILVDHPANEKLTNLFGRHEPRLYARLTYSQALKDAIGAEDKDGFHFPDMKDFLIMPDYALRTSVKQQTRKILESITKIFERGEGRRGGFFSR